MQKICSPAQLLVFLQLQNDAESTDEKDANDANKVNHSSKHNEEVKPQPKEETKKVIKSEKQPKKTVAATEVGAAPVVASKKESSTKQNADKPQVNKAAKKKSEENPKPLVNGEVDGNIQSPAVIRVEQPVKEQVNVQAQQTAQPISNKQSKKKRAELSNLHQLSE